MPVRAILFDLGDTLFRLDPMPEDIDRRLASLLAGHSLCDEASLPGHCTAVLAALRDEMLASWTAGHHDEHDLPVMFARHFATRGIDLDADARHAAADILGAADVERFSVASDVDTRVEAFAHAGYRLAAVSNTTTRPALLEDFLRSVGLLPIFDAVLFSSAAGIRKPHPEFYRRALAALRVAPEEAVFVGDRVREDVLGPRSVGIRAALTHEFRQEDPGDSNPLAVLPSLPALHEVLASLD